MSATVECLSNWFQLPKELLVKPRPLVTFVGLNVEENNVHRNIWDRFMDFKRSEKLPVKYQLIQSLVENPVAKIDKKVISQKSTKGILKKNWIKKYLSEKTTVAVLFYQLDWTDLPLSAKIDECTTYIKRQMSYIANSDIELIVVLIQSIQTLPADQNAVATDCISSICTKTNLTAKQFNILVIGDQLHGYIVRLENLFYDLCLNYFNQKIKKVLSVIDSLKKSTQQLQFVHYTFKVAYFYEICQDSKNALKYYHQGYSSLLTVNDNLYNLSEIKTIASYLLYKMCKLMFELDLQKNAIHLFETHIDHFKSKSIWDFENHAWLSMQYKVFGNIFDDGIKSGLRTNQVQHPGYYYHYAAQSAQLRRAVSQKYSENDGALSHITPDVNEKFNQIIFCGQMPWSGVPENVIFSTWVTQEKRFNHSIEIIGLFSKAADQFKIFNCNRMRKNIIVEMAAEYFYDGDYGQALTLFLHMIHDYQNEKWWPIISDLILKAYYCAFLAVSIPDFLKLCLKALYSKVLIPEENKNEIYENLHSILFNKVPSCNLNSFGTSVNLAHNFAEKWTKSLQNFEIIQFNADDECFCINFKIQFIQTTFQTINDVRVMFFIQNNHYALLQLNRIVVHVKIKNETEIHELIDGNFELQSNSLSKISMNIPLKFRNSFETDYCEVVAVDLVLGMPSERTLILKFNNRSNEKAHLKHKQSRIFKNNEFDLIDNIFKTSIVPTFSTNLLIRLLHDKPVLIGEWYPIKIELINADSSKMNDFVFQFKCFDSNEDAVSLSTDKKTLLQSLTFEDLFDGLEVRGTRNYEFFIKTTHVGELSINVTVFYHQSINDNEVSFSKSEQEVIAIVKPFELETKFCTPFFRNITRLYVDESFLMNIGIVSLSCHTLFVQKTDMETKLNVKLQNTLENTCVYELIVRKDEVLKNIVCLKVVQESEHSYHLCDFNIFWKRFESEKNELNMTVISLHGLPVEYVPLFIDVQLPPFGVLHQNIPITYNFYNKCDELIELRLDIIQSESFLFSGYKKVKISILPNCKKSLNFNAYSLLTGKRALPKLQLSSFIDCVVPSSMSEVKVVELCKRSLPSSIFITPKDSTLHNFSSSS